MLHSYSPNSPAVLNPSAPSNLLSSELPVGIYNTTPPTLTNGQVAPFQVDSSGNLKVAIAGILTSLLADNTATPSVQFNGSFGMVYDGTNWDMARGGLATVATPVGVANSLPLAFDATNNTYDALQLNEQDSLLIEHKRSQSYAMNATPAASASPVATAAKKVRSVYGSNGGAACWLMLFDAAAVPADGTAPSVPPVYIGANGYAGYDFGTYGRVFANGVSWAASSTFATLTAIGAATMFVETEVLA